MLGAMLLSTNAVDDALELLSAADFYSTANGELFAALEQMALANEPIDCLTVADTLDKRGALAAAGGPDRLLELEAATPTITHIARYAKIVAEQATLRRLATTGSEIVEIAHSRPDNVADAVDAAEAALYGVAHKTRADTATAVSDLAVAALDRLEALYEGQAPQGLRTGFASLDAILGGIAPTSLAVLGARPSMGKTSLALSCCLNVASAGDPVLLFSLEMNSDEIADRIIALDARVDAARLRTGKLDKKDWSRITKSFIRIADMPLWVDEQPLLTVNAIRAKARRAKARLGRLGLVVVDYLQLLAADRAGENRQVDVAEMSRGLKTLARELGTPVLALSQLSRALEARADKRPMLSDLRESGAIEQDADIVAFIYRDEVYNEDTPDRGLAEIIVAKHRHGPTGTARLAWLPAHTLFADPA